MIIGSICFNLEWLHLTSNITFISCFFFSENFPESLCCAAVQLEDVFAAFWLFLSLCVLQERDGMRAILESYDSELAATEYSPQLSRRVKEAEDVLQKTQSHYVEMEVSFHKHISPNVRRYWKTLCCVAHHVVCVSRRAQSMRHMNQEHLKCPWWPLERSESDGIKPHFFISSRPGIHSMTPQN